MADHFRTTKRVPIVIPGRRLDQTGFVETEPRKRRKNLSTAPIRRLLTPVIAAVAILALLLPGVAAAKQDGHDDNGKGKVANVMTRNLYLGADLAPAIGAPSLEAF